MTILCLFPSGATPLGSPSGLVSSKKHIPTSGSRDPLIVLVGTTARRRIDHALRRCPVHRCGARHGHPSSSSAPAPCGPVSPCVPRTTRRSRPHHQCGPALLPEKEAAQAGDQSGPAPGFPDGLLPVTICVVSDHVEADGRARPGVQAVERDGYLGGPDGDLLVLHVVALRLRARRCGTDAVGSHILVTQGPIRPAPRSTAQLPDIGWCTQDRVPEWIESTTENSLFCRARQLGPGPCRIRNRKESQRP